MGGTLEGVRFRILHLDVGMGMSIRSREIRGRIRGDMREVEVGVEEGGEQYCS